MSPRPALTVLPALACGFHEAAKVVPLALECAKAVLSDEGLTAFEQAGCRLGKLGRGPLPLLAFLKVWPDLASIAGEGVLPILEAAVMAIHRSPNGRAIAPFIESMAAVANTGLSMPDLQAYCALCLRVLEATSGSIHGLHKTYASARLPDFLNQAPQLLGRVSLEGLARWTEYGLHHYAHHPDQQCNYFSFQSADSHAVLQRERPGDHLADHLRLLDLYLLACWDDCVSLVPISTVQIDKAHTLIRPYAAPDGLRLPDTLAPRAGVCGLNRYRAALAHMAAHRRWSTALFADNLSPMQRLATECLEDARMDRLIVRTYPGMASTLQQLHPTPVEGACNPQTHSCFVHRLALLSRALLCPQHEYTDPALLLLVQRFDIALAQGISSTGEMAALALAYVALTRQQSDQQAHTDFTDSDVDYRDDNRHLWKYHEMSDDEESFDTPPTTKIRKELRHLPARLYPEWDYASQTYRPQWVSLYEGLHPSTSPAAMDAMLQRHNALTRRLKRLLELLKPQDKVRLRYQENGSELDLDIALRALTNLKAGNSPDTRIQQSHRSNGRSIAVTLLLDLSESLAAPVPGTEQTVLELSQEAVVLLAWTIDQLGDPLAIAGFNSNTRSAVNYWHIKGFDEPWDTAAKSRLAAIQAAYSTRMGTAMRHAAHTLKAQQADKKLLLILTDGEPSDVDVHDAHLLIADARQSVQELEAQGIATFCISLDAKADGYVKDIFGKRYTVIDDIAQLPEKLPQVFIALTR